MTHFTEFIESAIVFCHIVLFQPFYRVRVMHTTERLLRWDKVWIELGHIVSERRLQHTVDDVTDQIFDAIEQLIERDERTFGFDVTEFGNVTPRATRFRTIALRNAEYIAQRRQACLQIQLRALR